MTLHRHARTFHNCALHMTCRCPHKTQFCSTAHGRLLAIGLSQNTQTHTHTSIYLLNVQTFHLYAAAAQIAQVIRHAYALRAHFERLGASRYAPCLAYLVQPCEEDGVKDKAAWENEVAEALEASPHFRRYHGADHLMIHMKYAIQVTWLPLMHAAVKEQASAYS